MKRLATYVMTLMLTGMVAFAEDVSSSITFSEQLNGGAMSPTLTLGDGSITLEFSQGEGTTEPQYYTNGNALRVYKYNTIRVSTLNEAVIKSVKFIHPTHGYSFKPYGGTLGNTEYDLFANGLVKPNAGGTCIHDGDKTSTWTSSADNQVTQVTFTLGNIAVTRIAEMEIVTDGGEMYSLQAPTIEPNGGDITSADYITISSGTPMQVGIRYTIDGTDPKNGGEEYMGAFTLSESATVRARAYSVNEFHEYTWGYMSQATFNVYQLVTSVAQYNSLPNGTNVQFDCDLYAVYQNDRYLYVRDDNYDILLVYGNVGNSYENGLRIAAGARGTKTDYSGLTELTGPSNFASGVGGGNTYWPDVTTPVSSLTASSQSQLYRLQGTVKDITTVSNRAAFTLVGESDGAEILVYNRFGLDFSTLREGELLAVDGFVALYNGALQFYPYSLIRDENQITFSPQGGTYYGTQTVYANYELVAGEPFGITLWGKYDDGTTISANADDGSVSMAKSGWAIAKMHYYSSNFAREMDYTDSVRFEIIQPINFSFDPSFENQEYYNRPITVHITATQGDEPFTGVIYYSLTGDTTTANASVYNPKVGIYLSESSNIAVWASDENGNKFFAYAYYNVEDMGPAYFDMMIDPQEGTYYGRKTLNISVSVDNASLTRGTWKLEYADGSSTSGEFVNESVSNVILDKSCKLILDYEYWDGNYEVTHNVKDTLEYTILSPLKITFDPAAGKYSGTQNVYVGFEIQDPNSYFGFNSRSWTMYYDDGTIYTGNFDDNETVEVHGSGSLQVEANCYDEVGNITYADSARYEILQPTLTVIPEPGTYYGELTPKVVVENIDYEYEVRYSIRYDDGDIEAPNYNPWNDGVTAVKKSGMLYVMVIWYDETGMQHYLSKDRLHYTIMPEVQNDINQDGQMDVSDVVVLSSLVMGEGVNYYNKNMADVNGDGEVNVTDVVALANKTMGE